eukprot:1190571-Prorocentrum_minimum.AAC.3
MRSAIPIATTSEICFLDVARPRQAIGQAERRGPLREASPRGSVGGGRASSRKKYALPLRSVV